MARRKKPKQHLGKLAAIRIERLWRLSSDAASTRPDRARVWMRTARKIAQKARIKIPGDMSRSICKVCGTVWVPGRNCQVRLRNNRSRHISVTCLVCGTIRRFLVIREG